MNGLVHPIEVNMGKDPQTGKPAYRQAWSLRKAARLERRARDGYAPIGSPTSRKYRGKGVPAVLVRRYEALLNVLMKRLELAHKLTVASRQGKPWAIMAGKRR